MSLSPLDAEEPTTPTESRTGMREALIRAALHMVQTEGIDAISVREVARRAGVSSGAPFRHFKDRNALLAALAEDGLLRLGEAVATALAVVPDDPVERLKAIGVAHARFAARHPAHFRVMHHPALALDEFPRIAELIQHQKKQLRSLVLEGQARGLLRNADPDLVVLLCVSVVGGLARLFVDGGRECPVDLTIHSLEQVDALANAVVELTGLGIVDPAVEDDYAKSFPASIRGRKRRAKPRATKTTKRTPRRTRA